MEYRAEPKSNVVLRRDADGHRANALGQERQRMKCCNSKPRIVRKTLETAEARKAPSYGLQGA